MSIPIRLIPSLPILLGHFAHQYASLYCYSLFDDNTSPKFKSVYLNRLAIYVVSQYLQQAGLSTVMSQTALSQSECDNVDSEEVVLSLLTDATDLDVPNYGRLECRPLAAEDEVMEVPRSTWSDRVGYVAVQFNDDLSEAVLLGFVKQVTTTLVPLSELRSLDDFFPYLAEIKQQAPVQVSIQAPIQAAIQAPIQLGNWFQNIFQDQWQAIEAVLQPHQFQPALRPRTRDAKEENLRERGRLVVLGENGPNVSMVLGVEQTSDYEYSVAVAFWPPENTYLPGNLQLTILDDEEQAVLEAQTRDDNEKIEMKFKGETGDRFAVQMSAGEVSMTEFFILP